MVQSPMSTACLSYSENFGDEAYSMALSMRTLTNQCERWFRAKTRKLGHHMRGSSRPLKSLAGGRLSPTFKPIVK